MLGIMIGSGNISEKNLTWSHPLPSLVESQRINPGLQSSGLSVMEEG